MNDFRVWECLVCGFIYDEVKGWPDDGIEPGTRWEDVPEDWLCPDCGVGKADFDMVDITPVKKAGIGPSVAAVVKTESPEVQKSVAPLQSGSDTWQCHECDFIYSEVQGWQEDNLIAGTSWNQVPIDWSCPDCGAEKTAFAPVARKRTGSLGIKTSGFSTRNAKDRIIVIGSGLAAYNLVQAFRRLDQETPILMLTRDDGHFYSKPQISTGYTKQKRADELVITPAEKMAANLDIDIRVFTEVTAINTDQRFVEVNDQQYAYSKLVLAWGASCIAPPMEGNALSEVYQVNDLLDYNRFRTALIGRKKVLIIGAGLIGSEYANDLANAGFEIEAVDPLNGPLGTLLPEAASQAVQRGLEGLGVTYHFGTVVERIDRVAEAGIRATLANGKTVDADIVLSAVGVRPRLQLAQDAGIETNRGIVVNRLLETATKNIYSLGDCAEVEGHVLYYLLPLMACAKTLAATLNGQPTEVSYGAMPVMVKTPACPLSVLPPPIGVEGDWSHEEGQGTNDVKALFYDKEGKLRGFALTGKHSAEAMKLAKDIPALMP